MDEQKQSELMLANEHASVTLSSLVSCDWSYVMATADQRGDVPALFIERLMAATYHTILPEWGSYLFKAGLKKKPVTNLPILGQPDDFAPCEWNAAPKIGRRSSLKGCATASSSSNDSNPHDPQAGDLSGVGF